MVNVTIEGDRAVFQVEGLDRMWASRSRLEIPLAHIVDVRHDPEHERYKKLIVEVEDPAAVGLSGSVSGWRP